MKLKLTACLAVAVLLAALFAGCSKKESAAPAAGDAEADSAKPRDVVDKVLSGFQSGSAGGLETSFSSQLDPKFVSEFLKKKIDSAELINYSMGKAVETKDTAEVPYTYWYQVKAKGPEGVVEATGKRIKQANTALLVKEKGGWKILRFDPELDSRIEKAMLVGCAEAVSYAQFAEEKYFQFNKGFTNNFADLANYLPVDRNACAKLEVTGVKAANYTITAVTKNIPPCEMIADRYWAFKTVNPVCPGRVLEPVKLVPQAAPPKATPQIEFK